MNAIVTDREPDQTNEKRPRAYEGADLHPAVVAQVAFALVVLIGFALGSLGWLFHSFTVSYPDRTSHSAPIVTARDLPPLPRLQVDPVADLAKLRQEEDQHLDHYGWADRSQGLAKIPIDRAITLWAKTAAAQTMAPALPASSTPLTPSSIGATFSLERPSDEVKMCQEKARAAMAAASSGESNQVTAPAAPALEPTHAP